MWANLIADNQNRSRLHYAPCIDYAVPLFRGTTIPSCILALRPPDYPPVIRHETESSDDFITTLGSPEGPIVARIASIGIFNARNFPDENQREREREREWEEKAMKKNVHQKLP